MSDVEDLLEPIGESEPSGPDLRLDATDSTFQTLKEHMTSVDAAVAATEDEIKDSNWSGVVSLCYSALREKSKDLELITALAAGWARTEGIAGIENGLALIHGSLQGFWDTMHPGFDPDDGEITLPLRARWLNWVDSPKGYLEAVRQAPLVPRSSGGSYTWLDHENSALLDDATFSAERRQELSDTGIVSDADWQAALGAVEPATLAEHVACLGRCLELIGSLAELCTERFAADEDEEPQEFYKLRTLIDEMNEYLSERIVDEPDPEAVAEGGAAGAVASAGGAMNSRQEALRQLEQVGRYFRQAEPHSPISYLIARAVKWGSMPLDQLYKDVLRNDEVLNHLWETLGLDASEADGDEGDGY